MPRLSKSLHHKKVKSKKYWYNKLDAAMGELVRSKERCEWCGSTTNQMNWAHVISRSNKALRWDLMNGMCLCSYCHAWKWHDSPLEGVAWFREKYPERYDYLMRNKNRFADRTEEDYRTLLEAIQNRRLDMLIYKD